MHRHPGPRAISVASALVLALLTIPAPVRAEPQTYDDEPGPTYLIHPIHPRAERLLVAPVAPCSPCQRGSGFRVDLQASAGYMGFLGPLFLDKAHGPVVQGALVLSWGHGTQIGVRLAGFYSQQTGWHEPLWDGTPRDIAPRLFGGYAAVQARFQNGIWVAKGFGVAHYDREASDRTAADNYDASTMNVPELVLAAGYDLRLGRHLALQLSAEVAGMFSVRASINAGLQVSF